MSVLFLLLSKCQRIMGTIKREFFPGDRWLYFKIYTGVNAADEILLAVVLPFVRNLKRSQIIEKWFYIRYSDPDFHLRVRFLLKNATDIGLVTILLNKKLRSYFKNKSVYKLEISTYCRELERYGKNNIENMEMLFFYDSESMLMLLDKRPLHRWMCAFKIVDGWFDVVGFDIEEKIKITDALNLSFLREFGYNKFNAKQLNKIYRKHQKTIWKILEGKDNANPLDELNSVFRQRYKVMKKYLHTVNEKGAKLNMPSLVHMSLNRLFMTDNRVNELLIYNFLYRYYKSKKARTL